MDKAGSIGADPLHARGANRRAGRGTPREERGARSPRREASQVAKERRWRYLVAAGASRPTAPWRNGIRRGFKILGPQGRLGSTPSGATERHTTSDILIGWRRAAARALDLVVVAVAGASAEPRVATWSAERATAVAPPSHHCAHASLPPGLLPDAPRPPMAHVKIAALREPRRAPARSSRGGTTLARVLQLVRTTAPPAKPDFVGDAALVAAFRRGDPAAGGALYDRHADHVHRVLRRILGPTDELPDLAHDVFLRALRALDRVEDPDALKGWLTTIAVHVARTAIVRRKRRSWLWFLPPERLPEVDSGAASADVLDAFRATHAVLETLPVDERIAFALRFVDSMELTEVAAACGTSLATIKRRLARATEKFTAEARRHPALEPWLEGGARWSRSSNR